MLTTPSMKQIFGQVKLANEKRRGFELEINRKVDQYRESLLKKRAHQARELQERCYAAQSAAEKTAREQIMAFAKSVWDGEAGPGILVVLGQKEFLAPNDEFSYKLARILDTTGKNGAEIEEGYIPTIFSDWKNNHGEEVNFLSYGQPESGILNPSQRSLLERWEPGLVEVALGQPTEEELRELYKKVSFLSPEIRIRLFGNQAEFEVGELHHIASCSHHTGETSASIVYLPNGGWAVVASYSGDDSDRTWCPGVVSNPGTEISVSGKHGSCTIEGEFTLPSTEEIEFLRQKFPDLS